MKRLILACIILFATVICADAAWTVTPSKYSQYKDPAGQHFVLRLKCVSDGSAGTYVLSSANISKNFYDAIMDKFLFSITINPTGTLSVAPTIVITNPAGATVYSNTADFEVTNTIQALAGLYSGYPPHFFEAWTITFNDIGAAAEEFVMDLDFVR